LIKHFPTEHFTEQTKISGYNEDYSADALEMSKQISNNYTATSGFKLFGAGIKTTFSHSDTASYGFFSKYIYGSYNLYISQKRYRFNATADILKNYLTTSFIADLNNLSADQIVAQYGTHVMTDISLGGKLNIMFQSETLNEDRYEAARTGLNIGVSVLTFNASVGYDHSYNQSLSSKNYSKKLVYKTIGGDPSKQLIGNLQLDGPNTTTPPSSLDLSGWTNSVTADNSVLIQIGTNGLIPIYDLVSDPTKKAALKTAVDNYILNNSVCLYPRTLLDAYKIGATDPSKLKILGFPICNIIPLIDPNQEKVFSTGYDPILTKGQTIYTKNNNYSMTFQNDGNVVIRRVSDGRSMWSTNTAGSNGYYLVFQPDGNLVIYKQNRTESVWASYIYNPNVNQTEMEIKASDAKYVFQGDGNFFIYIPDTQSNKAAVAGSTGGYGSKPSTHPGKIVAD